MKKFLTYVLLVSILCCVFPFDVQAVVLETEENDDFSGKSTYYKLFEDQNKNMELVRITEQEFESFVNQRSAVYVEGWEVVSISGLTAAYISLHYQTVTSGGKKVFDISTTYFEVSPQNGYAGSLNYLSSSVHSLNMRYDFQNRLGDAGYRTHRFYPQQ